MGKHWHYRVCIEGEKDHSSGGSCYDELVRWLKKHPDGVMEQFPVNISHTPENVSDIVIFMITRMPCHHHRKLTAILTPYFDKRDRVHKILHVPMDITFDLHNRRQKHLYDTLGKIYSPENNIVYGISEIDPQQLINIKYEDEFTRTLIQQCYSDGMSEEEICAWLKEI